MSAPAHFLQSPEPEIHCIGCGCTEFAACQDDSQLSPNGACFWVCVIEERGIGLCSRCAATPISELLERMRLLPPALTSVAPIAAGRMAR